MPDKLTSREQEKQFPEYTIDRTISQFYIDIHKKIEKSLEPYIKDTDQYEEYKKYISESLLRMMKRFNTSYETAKQVLDNTIRDNGQKYFDHIKQALDIYLEEFLEILLDPPIEEKKIFFAIKNEINRISTIIHHDTLEDTDLKEDFFKSLLGGETALGIIAISKPPFYYFIENKDDQKTMHDLQSAEHLNSKFLLSDKLKHKITLKKQTQMSPKEKFMHFGSDNYEITPEEEQAIDSFKTIKEKYKHKATNQYFDRFKNLDSLINYLQQENERLGYHIDPKGLGRVVRNVVFAKICDRADNIRNIVEEWKDKPEKIEKKLTETEEKLYPIAQAFDEAYGKNCFPYLQKIVETEKKKYKELLSPQVHATTKKTKRKAKSTLQNEENK